MTLSDIVTIGEITPSADVSESLTWDDRIYIFLCETTYLQEGAKLVGAYLMHWAPL